MRGGQIMHAGKTLWMVVTLAAVGAAALALPYATRGQNSQVAAPVKGPDFVSFPQAAANIVAGLKIRTTLVNTGDEPVQAVVSVLDAGGNLVKQETLTVAPGAMQSSEISCAAPRFPQVPTQGHIDLERGGVRHLRTGSNLVYGSGWYHRAHLVGEARGEPQRDPRARRGADAVTGEAGGRSHVRAEQLTNEPREHSMKGGPDHARR